MADFNLPPWLIPKTEPWQALAAGVQAGTAIGHNLLQGQAIYAQAQQAAQAMALRQDQFRAENESRTLQNEIARTKMNHDAEDFATLQEFLPQVAGTTTFDQISKLAVPPLHNAQNYLNFSLMLDRHKTERAAGEMAREIAGKAPGTPGYLETVDKWVSLAPDLSLSPAVEHLRQRDSVARIAAEKLKFTSTTDTENLDAATQREKRAAEIEPTDPEGAATLRRDAALLRSKLIGPTETIESYVDEQGHQQFRITRGPTTAKGPQDVTKPTAPNVTKLQQGLLGADKALQLGIEAYNALTPESVGVRGTINQVLINEGLAQIIPGLKKGGVTEARTLLGNFNERAVQALTASGDKRVSDKDMARFQRILPKLSPNESLTSARDKIKTFMDEMRREASTDASTLGVAKPEWTWTEQELVDAYKNGTITLDEGRRIRDKYFPKP